MNNICNTFEGCGSIKSFQISGWGVFLILKGFICGQDCFLTKITTLYIFCSDEKDLAIIQAINTCHQGLKIFVYFIFCNIKNGSSILLLYNFVVFCVYSKFFTGFHTLFFFVILDIAELDLSTQEILLQYDLKWS